MSGQLIEQSCMPCRGGIPPLDIDEARRHLEQTPAWNLLEGGGKIERTFWFSNFRESLDFVRAAGELAEAEQHHPDIAFGWGFATISLRTKKIGGLHQNDFIVAAKTDRLARDHGALDAPRRRQQTPASPMTSGIPEPNGDRGSTPADRRQ
jgi:4a-hydroxytetrahydrobiopterin dehydratase